MAKWALVTGASAGIGEATALELSSKGYNLILVARRIERLQKLKAKIEKQAAQSNDQSGTRQKSKVKSATKNSTKGRSKIQVVTATVDLRNAFQVQQFVSQHSKIFSQLSLLVNNAGLAKGTDKLQDGKIDDWNEMFDTNVKGLLNLTREVLPYFVAQQDGHIVNLGSVAGRWVYPGGAVYCATKFAVRALSEGLRMDLLGKNVRVTNIEPGMVKTEFSLVRLGAKDKAEQVYAGMKPLTAKDIAETISWVVTRPKHVNIQELVIYPTDQASVRDVHRL